MWVDDLSVVLGGRAIGWLDGAHDFPRGTVSPIFFERLGELASDPFEPFTAGGLARLHSLPVCRSARWEKSVCAIRRVSVRRSSSDCPLHRGTLVHATD